MTAPEIRLKLTGVFREVFDDPALDIFDNTNANDVEGWDSIVHVTLIVAVEKAFQTSFTTREVRRLANVGDFIRLIETRVK